MLIYWWFLANGFQILHLISKQAISLLKFNLLGPLEDFFICINWPLFLVPKLQIIYRLQSCHPISINGKNIVSLCLRQHFNQLLRNFKRSLKKSEATTWYHTTYLGICLLV